MNGGKTETERANHPSLSNANYYCWNSMFCHAAPCRQQHNTPMHHATTFIGDNADRSERQSRPCSGWNIATHELPRPVCANVREKRGCWTCFSTAKGEQQGAAPESDCTSTEDHSICSRAAFARVQWKHRIHPGIFTMALVVVRPSASWLLGSACRRKRRPRR